MDTSLQPDPQEVSDVEASLYNRMLRNAFFGFMKSAVIGAVIGLALGGLFALGVHAEILPHLPIMGEKVASLSTTLISGALHGAAWLGGAAGSFGAVAGIQSTRDTRRFFLMHEGRNLSPEEAREQAISVQPDMVQKADSRNHFQKIVADKTQDKSESPRIG